MKKIIFEIIFLLWLICVYATRIEDIASIKGVRINQLIGYGIVVGLNGTGDKSGSVEMTRSLQNMFSHLGLNLDAKQINSKNVAVVTVTAELPPFIEEGARIDVKVCSTGTATSLAGGRLLLTPLKGVDGEVYALAQGDLIIQSTNYPTIAYIPDGAVIEKKVPTEFIENGKITLLLNKPNFTTAKQVASIINQEKRQKIAYAVDAGTIIIKIPSLYKDDPVGFISGIMQLPVILPDREATVVINQRTGTVVVDENVWVSPVAISQDGLTMTIPAQPQSQTQLKVMPFMVPQGTRLKKIIDALNAMKVSTKDLIAILQALKKSGALHAKLIIM